MENSYDEDLFNVALKGVMRLAVKLQICKKLEITVL